VGLGDAVPALRPRGLRWLARLGERALALDAVNRIHAAAAHHAEPEPFLRAVLEALDVRCEVPPEELRRIPAEGPVVVVSNHPFGGLDAIVLIAVLRAVRRDARILANRLIERIPQARPLILPVDVFGAPGAARRNADGLRRALAHLQGGGLLAVFPGGTVSHFGWRRLAVEDPAWTGHVGALVQRSKAAVVPVFFAGRNSALFHAAGLLHPRLRTALLPREVVRRRGSVVRLTIGRAIPFGRLRSVAGRECMTRFLRVVTHALGHAAASRAGTADSVARRPIAAAEDPGALESDVAGLPPGARLLSDGPLLVLAARATQVPSLMREIGRRREETFRAAGMGTGGERDLDEFDAAYEHVVLWDRERRRVAGAYRVAHVGDVLAGHGIAGLYTATLFRFEPGFFERLGPAMELGRSWIGAEYQRTHRGLEMLWRGIGALVTRRPECGVLFGTVSLSRDLHPLSRDVIASFLHPAAGSAPWPARVWPARPYRIRGRRGRLARDACAAVRTIDDVSLLVSQIEADGRGVPVLLRRYLRLHSTFLGFTEDPAFADTVDGLMITDLRRTDPVVLRHFMGREGHASFARFHGLAPAGALAQSQAFA
jgi:putative hemolysin